MRTHRLPRRRRALCAAAIATVLGLAACSGGAGAGFAAGPPVAGTPTAPLPTPPAAPLAPAVAELDARVHAVYPDELRAVAAPGFARDATGLIGRNAEWGALWSPRFQMGAGAALRVAIARGDADLVRRGFAAIAAGGAVIEASGRVPSSLPPDLFPGAAPSAVDLASGAAFFLGDACLGLLALRSAPQFAAGLDAASVAATEAATIRGARWLATQRTLLRAADAEAPNRLLFDARAFAACGRLAGDEALAREADPFVHLAIAALDPAGWFREGAGWDTSYQAVAIQVGRDVLASGPVADAPELVAALGRATDWLAGRVGSDGRVDSSGNARTCSGGESFLGAPKRLAVATVFVALAYEGVVADRADWRAAAERVAAWARANPATDPCN